MAESSATTPSTAPVGGRKPYGVIPAFAALAAVVLFLCSAGYVVASLAARETAPLSDNEFGSADSAFGTSALIWIILFALMMFNPRSAFSLKLRLALILSLVGFPMLAMAINARGERVAEDRLFAGRGVYSTKIYPIVGTEEHRGRGISYYARIDPYNHGNGIEFKISKPDFDRIGAVAPHDIYSAQAPDAKFCVTLKIETSGRNGRVLWPKYTSVPSEWIAPCSAARVAANRQSYHEAQLTHYTPEQCARLKAGTADQYNQIEKYKADHLLSPQQGGVFSGPVRHFTPSDVGPIYGGHGSTRALVCP